VPVAGLVDQGLDRVGVAHVDHCGRGGPGTALGQVTGGPFGPVLVDVGHNHRVPTGHQRAGQGLPDARGTSGDDCYPAHDDLRSRRSRAPKLAPPTAAVTTPGVPDYANQLIQAGHYCPKGYTGPQWSQEVLAIGTPAIWWGSMLALLFCLGWWLLHRDWRAGAVLCGVPAGWAPWFPLVSRTKFYYYALEFEPFLILSIVLCLGLILGPAAASALRRSIGAGWSAPTC